MPDDTMGSRMASVLYFASGNRKWWLVWREIISIIHILEHYVMSAKSQLMVKLSIMKAFT